MCCGTPAYLPSYTNKQPQTDSYNDLGAPAPAPQSIKLTATMIWEPRPPRPNQSNPFICCSAPDYVMMHMAQIQCVCVWCVTGSQQGPISAN